jgi:hypothetical protein
MKYIKTFQLFEGRVKKHDMDVISENLDYNHKEYLKWKRKNVSYRGMKQVGVENGVAARFGDGLYTAALSNNSYARTYGNLYFAVNARPKHPKIVQSPNYAEIFIQNIIVNYSKEHKLEFLSDFYKYTTVKDEILKLGYDGLEISAVEYVNYTPDMNKIKYIKTEEELKEYYINNVKLNESYIDKDGDFTIQHNGNDLYTFTYNNTIAEVYYNGTHYSNYITVPEAYLDNINRNSRKNGIITDKGDGAKLINYIKKYMKEEGAKILTLRVENGLGFGGRKNNKLWNYYLTLGFKPTYTEKECDENDGKNNGAMHIDL